MLSLAAFDLLNALIGLIGKFVNRLPTLGRGLQLLEKPTLLKAGTNGGAMNAPSSGNSA
jgi:hypothetical protein